MPWLYRCSRSRRGPMINGDPRRLATNRFIQRVAQERTRADTSSHRPKNSPVMRWEFSNRASTKHDAGSRAVGLLMPIDAPRSGWSRTTCVPGCLRIRRTGGPRQARKRDCSIPLSAMPRSGAQAAGCCWCQDECQRMSTHGHDLSSISAFETATQPIRTLLDLSLLRNYGDQNELTERLCRVHRCCASSLARDERSGFADMVIAMACRAVSECTDATQP